jgi:hypothetical protein
MYSGQMNPIPPGGALAIGEKIQAIQSSTGAAVDAIKSVAT